MLMYTMYKIDVLQHINLHKVCVIFNWSFSYCGILFYKVKQLTSERLNLSTKRLFLSRDTQVFTNFHFRIICAITSEMSHQTGITGIINCIDMNCILIKLCVYYVSTVLSSFILSAPLIIASKTWVEKLWVGQGCYDY